MFTDDLFREQADQFFKLDMSKYKLLICALAKMDRMEGEFPQDRFFLFRPV